MTRGVDDIMDLQLREISWGPVAPGQRDEAASKLSYGTSPRTEIVVGSNVGGDESGRTSGVTTVAALIRPPWKLLLGEGPGDILDMAGHPGPQVRARSVFCGFVGVKVATLKGAKPMVCIPHSSEQQSNCVRAQMRPV